MGRKSEKDGESLKERGRKSGKVQRKSEKGKESLEKRVWKNVENGESLHRSRESLKNWEKSKRSEESLKIGGWNIWKNLCVTKWIMTFRSL